ncbi:uncharacterized protein LOC113759144, partial [Coffea eugenioides]|uniref:uncharacterized protein LOC113759144 n=1 Tax=Coffea eugenioides TaxID=49369 RepID=UPI000F6138FA
MTDILERLVPQQGQGTGQLNQLGNQEIGEDRALERFQKFSPPKFSGGPDPDIAENWLENIRNIFDALDYSEEREVNFAVFQLEGPARAWFAPELVITERKRIRRFIQGLNLEIQDGLAAAQIETFSDALEKAQRVQISKAKLRVFQERKRDAPSSSHPEASRNTVPPPKVGKGAGGVRLPLPSSSQMQQLEGTPSQGTQIKRGQSRTTPQGSQAMNFQPICGYCGKGNHTENNCWVKERKCLRCGSADHQVSNCPRKQPRENNHRQGYGTTSERTTKGGNRPQVPTGTYASIGRQTLGSTEVVE